MSTFVSTCSFESILIELLVYYWLVNRSRRGHRGLLSQSHRRELELINLLSRSIVYHDDTSDLSRRLK